MKLRRMLAAALAAAALAAAGEAAAQASAKGLFKGKVKEGLYEVKSEADLSGVPGIPKEQMKSSETRRRCVTRQEVERGVEPGKDCKVKSYKESGPGTTVVMECQDGAVTEMKFAFAGDGFSSEMRTQGTDNGKPFVSVFRSQAKHVGACPPADAKPAAKAPEKAPEKK